MTQRKDRKLFLDILANSVSGKIVSGLPEDADVRALYNLSYAHKVICAIWYALKDIKPSSPMQKTLLSRLQACFESAKKQIVLQDYYTDMVCSFCRDKGIRFALLKGAVLKHLYPEPIMRSSCDIDILVDRNRIDEIITEFCGLGFDYHEDEDSDEAKHAKLTKESVVIELHRSLCFDGAFGGHYDELFSVFESTDGIEYTLCPEELYTYTLVHASNHFIKGVNTLRTLCDLYLIQKEYLDMDRQKLDILLKATGIADFEKAMTKLVKAVFEGTENDEELEIVLDYVLTNPLRADSQLAELQKEKVRGKTNFSRKLMLLFRRVLPSYEFICRRYPGAKRSKLLYPYYVAKRIFDAGKQGNIKQQLDAMGRVSDSEMDALAYVWKFSGLN